MENVNLTTGDVVTIAPLIDYLHANITSERTNHESFSKSKLVDMLLVLSKLGFMSKEGIVYDKENINTPFIKKHGQVLTNTKIKIIPENNFDINKLKIAISEKLQINYDDIIISSNLTFNVPEMTTEQFYDLKDEASDYCDALLIILN